MSYVLPPAPSKGGGDVTLSKSIEKLEVITPNPSNEDKQTLHNSNTESVAKLPGYITSDSKIIGALLQRAKEMRKNPTPAEAKLWDEIRNRKMNKMFVTFNSTKLPLLPTSKTKTNKNINMLKVFRHM